MERKPGESFAAYKDRRAESNLAVKSINADAKGGSTTARAQARKMRDNSKHAGAYGKSLLASFARKLATPELLATHQQHLQHAAERRTKRALASGASVLQLLAA